jgi:hypothetical protein
MGRLLEKLMGAPEVTLLLSNEHVPLLPGFLGYVLMDNHPGRWHALRVSPEVWPGDRLQRA